MLTSNKFKYFDHTVEWYISSVIFQIIAGPEIVCWWVCPLRVQNSFKYHHVPPELLRVGHNVMVHWHNPILDSHRFPLLYRKFPGVHWKQIYYSSSFVSFLVFYILFASKSFESKRYSFNIFINIRFIYLLNNWRRGHSIQVHCFIKYVRNLNKLWYRTIKCCIHG